MTLTLHDDLLAGAGAALIDGGTGETGSLVQIDTELCRVIAAPSVAGVWQLERGIDGTGNGFHASGTQVYPVIPTVQQDQPTSPPPASPGGPPTPHHVSHELGGSDEVDVTGLPGAGGGGITSPLDIAGCALWLDASDPTTINAGSPADNDPVSLWADKSGNGYDVARTSADSVQTIDITGASSGQWEPGGTTPVDWNASAADVAVALVTDGFPGATATVLSQVYTVHVPNGGAPDAFGASQDTLDVEPVVTVIDAGTSTPTWQTAVQNGLAVLRCDKTIRPQYLDFTGDALGLLAGLDGLTLFLVARSDQLTAGYGAFYFSTGADAAAYRLYHNGNSFSFVFDDAGSIGESLTLIAISVANLFGCFVMVSSAGQPIQIGFSRPSVLLTIAEDGSFAGPAVFEDTPSLAAHIGYEDYDPSGYAGDIGCLLVYDRALNGTEQQRVVDYLVSHWGLL